MNINFLIQNCLLPSSNSVPTASFSTVLTIIESLSHPPPSSNSSPPQSQISSPSIESPSSDIAVSQSPDPAQSPSKFATIAWGGLELEFWSCDSDFSVNSNWKQKNCSSCFGSDSDPNFDSDSDCETSYYDFRYSHNCHCCCVIMSWSECVISVYSDWWLKGVIDGWKVWLMKDRRLSYYKRSCISPLKEVFLWLMKGHLHSNCCLKGQELGGFYYLVKGFSQ